MNKTSYLARTRQTGASLIEVLVSVVVLAIGMLGIAAMQASALRNNIGAFERSAAVFLTHSILDAMRASMKPDATSPGSLVVRSGYSTGRFICLDSEIPTGDTLVANDFKRWLDAIRGSLNGRVEDNNACGMVTCEAGDANRCTATVLWNNPHTLEGASGRTVVTRSRL